MTAFLGILLGIALLIAGGTALVAGASKVASRFGISPMIIGLTIVGFGTSAPELVVNIMGAITGQSELAFGNVIGSNISNLGLVLACAAFIRAIDIQGAVVYREVPLLLLITTVMTVMALDGLLDGEAPYFSRSDGVVLLLLFLIFLYMTVRDVLTAEEDDALMTEAAMVPLAAASANRFVIDWLLVPAGLVLLFIGGKWTVDFSVKFAELVGVPTSIVGLFVVAIGTSMPELVTSIIAALRRESDLALGNIIGSNIFNIGAIMGVTGLIIPVPVSHIMIERDMWVMLAAAVALTVICFARITTGKIIGALMFAAYVIYVAVVL